MTRLLSREELEREDAVLRLRKQDIVDAALHWMGEAERLREALEQYHEHEYAWDAEREEAVVRGCAERCKVCAALAAAPMLSPERRNPMDDGIYVAIADAYRADVQARGVNAAVESVLFDFACERERAVRAEAERDKLRERLSKIRPLLEEEWAEWRAEEAVVHEARRLSKSAGAINTTRDLDKALKRYDEARAAAHAAREAEHRREADSALAASEPQAGQEDGEPFASPQTVTATGAPADAGDGGALAVEEHADALSRLRDEEDGERTCPRCGKRKVE